MHCKNRVLYVQLLLAVGLLLFFSTSASAQFSVTITVDENCNGTLTNTSGFFGTLPCGQSADPGPGGLANAVTYGLFNPPGLVSGDLLLIEPASTGLLSDIIRFNSNGTIAGTTGTLVFYSDNGDGADSLADTGFPSSLYTNNLALVEVGAEGSNNGASYTPTAGQPGFITGSAGPVTYVIKSDIAPSVPEPSSILLIFAGVSLTWLSVRRGRSRGDWQRMFTRCQAWHGFRRG